MKPIVILIEMLVFAGIFTAVIAASLNKKETAASIHNYPPDIQEAYFRTHPRRDVSGKSSQVVLAKSLGVLMFTAILTGCALIAGAETFMQGFLCHEHDMLENVQMIFECYEKMLTFYRPESIVFLGFSSGGALILDLISYINELNDGGRNIPMPGMLIPVSPGSVPVTKAEKSAIKALDERDILIPAEYMDTAREIMCHGREIPEKYLATAHGDFRHAPVTHFYYGSAETLYAFAPSYAESFRNAGEKCVIHVGKGMHHCYALQYFIPGCKPAFEEIMRLILRHFQKRKG